jgi:hypothetical protein
MKKLSLLLPLPFLAPAALLLTGCSHVTGPRAGYRVFDVHLLAA